MKVIHVDRTPHEKGDYIVLEIIHNGLHLDFCIRTRFYRDIYVSRFGDTDNYTYRWAWFELNIGGYR